MKLTRYLAPISLALALGCGSGDDDDGAAPSVCIGAKCDTPQEVDAEQRAQQCADRQDEVLESSRRAFTEEYVRWSCADVEGVNANNQDDRGQEYCEYFAIVELPGHDALDLGRRYSEAPGDVTPFAICVDGDDSEGCALTISEDEIFDLEDDAASVVGQCIFTSWMTDVPGPLPCSAGNCTPDVLGFPVNAEFFRMKLDTNSNATASSLVSTCAEIRAKESILAPLPDFSDPNDEFQSPFYRGCWMAGSFGLSWRRSDPAICAVANRLAECGCSVPGVSLEQIGGTVVPAQPDAEGNVTKRGFHLGGWDDEFSLPAGCRYVKTGDNSRTIVSCDLTAADITASLSDPKEACREIYGNAIVAHAPIPNDVLACDDPGTQLSAECGTSPWNIGRENGE